MCKCFEYWYVKTMLKVMGVVALIVFVHLMFFYCCPCSHNHGCPSNCCNYDKQIKELKDDMKGIESMFNVLNTSIHLDLLETNKKFDELTNNSIMFVKIVDKSFKDLRSDLKTLEDKVNQVGSGQNVEALKEELNKYKNRIRLLGTLHNENWSLAKRGCLHDVMFLGENWTINRMPKALSLTEEDKKWLEKFLLK